jgi:hypothetical protein
MSRSIHEVDTRELRRRLVRRTLVALPSGLRRSQQLARLTPERCRGSYPNPLREGPKEVRRARAAHSRRFRSSSGGRGWCSDLSTSNAVKRARAGLSAIRPPRIAQGRVGRSSPRPVPARPPESSGARRHRMSTARSFPSSARCRCGISALCPPSWP